MEDYCKIQKQEALGNYFCLKMIYKLALQQILQENMNILEAWKPTEDMKFGLDIFFHMLFHITGTSSKCHKF